MAKFKQKTKPTQIAFSKSNYVLFAVSAAILVVGYLVLAQGPVDGFMSLSLAPVLLVIGYCVLIPVAIMYGGKKKSGGKIETSRS